MTFVGNIEEEAKTNTNYRKVVYTDQRLQLVVMSLAPNEEIGDEVHDGDQFVRVEEGQGTAVLDGESHALVDGTAVIIPKDVTHNIINASSTAPLKLYTIYVPPEHPPETIQKTKAEADAAENN